MKRSSFAAFVGAIAALIVIFQFVTGWQSLKDAFQVSNPNPRNQPTPNLLSGLGNPADTIRDYYQRLGNHDYAGALTLLTPETAAGVTAAIFQQQVENAERQTGSTVGNVNVTNVNEQGDNATATATALAANGQTVGVFQFTMKKINGKWLIDSAQGQ